MSENSIMQLDELKNIFNNGINFLLSDGTEAFLKKEPIENPQVVYFDTLKIPPTKTASVDVVGTSEFDNFFILLVKTFEITDFENPKGIKLLEDTSKTIAKLLKVCQKNAKDDKFSKENNAKYAAMACCLNEFLVRLYNTALSIQKYGRGKCSPGDFGRLFFNQSIKPLDLKDARDPFQGSNGAVKIGKVKAYKFPGEGHNGSILENDHWLINLLASYWSSIRKRPFLDRKIVLTPGRCATEAAVVPGVTIDKLIFLTTSMKQLIMERPEFARWAELNNMVFIEIKKFENAALEYFPELVKWQLQLPELKPDNHMFDQVEEVIYDIDQDEAFVEPPGSAFNSNDLPRSGTSEEFEKIVRQIPDLFGNREKLINFNRKTPPSGQPLIPGSLLSSRIVSRALQPGKDAGKIFESYDQVNERFLKSFEKFSKLSNIAKEVITSAKTPKEALELLKAKIPNGNDFYVVDVEISNKESKFGLNGPDNEFKKAYNKCDDLEKVLLLCSLFWGIPGKFVDPTDRKLIFEVAGVKSTDLYNADKKEFVFSKFDKLHEAVIKINKEKQKTLKENLKRTEKYEREAFEHYKSKEIGQGSFRELSLKEPSFKWEPIQPTSQVNSEVSDEIQTLSRLNKELGKFLKKPEVKVKKSFFESELNRNFNKFLNGNDISILIICLSPEEHTKLKNTIEDIHKIAGSNESDEQKIPKIYQKLDDEIKSCYKKWRYRGLVGIFYRIKDFFLSLFPFRSEESLNLENLSRIKEVFGSNKITLNSKSSEPSSSKKDK